MRDGIWSEMDRIVGLLLVAAGFATVAVAGGLPSLFDDTSLAISALWAAIVFALLEAALHRLRQRLAQRLAESGDAASNAPQSAPGKHRNANALDLVSWPRL